MKLRDTENILVLSLFLGITGVIAGTVLALVSQLTAEPIRQANIKNELDRGGVFLSTEGEGYIAFLMQLVSNK